MTQLGLRFDTLRVEMPLYEMSWVAHGRVQRVIVYAQCVDRGWPWWRPGMGWHGR